MAPYMRRHVGGHIALPKARLERNRCITACIARRIGRHMPEKGHGEMPYRRPRVSASAPHSSKPEPKPHNETCGLRGFNEIEWVAGPGLTPISRVTIKIEQTAVYLKYRSD